MKIQAVELLVCTDFKLYIEIVKTHSLKPKETT